MDEKKYMIRTENGYFKIHPAILRTLDNMIKKNTVESECVRFLNIAIKRWHLEHIEDFCISSKNKASILTNELTQFFNNNNEPINLDKYSYYYIVEINGNKEFEMRIDN